MRSNKTGIVLALTLVSALPATAFAGTPQSKVVKYSLMAGETSKAIAIAANVPVSLTGVQTTIGFRGVGQASLLHVPASFIEWVGLESPASGAVTQGFSGVAGTHIVYLDFSSQVDVQVASPDTIQIHNAGSDTRTGQVTLIW